MATPHCIPYEAPPVSLLPPATDAAGRIGSYRSFRHAKKGWITARVNLGSTTPVIFTILQALDTFGTGAKAINVVPIWLVENTGVSDALVPQAPAASFTTDAVSAEKFVVFEILPEAAMDIANGFETITIQTSASNAANITDATLQLATNFPGAHIPTTYSITS
jgi:hypothetical protein